MKLAQFAALAAAAALLVVAAAHLDQVRREEARSDSAPLASAERIPVGKLETHLERTPRDGRGWVTLARLHFESDRFDAAAQAYERALAVSPRIAQDPQVWCELADALGMAQGGSLKGRPREMIDKALSLKGSHPRALEMAGSAAAEARDFDRALVYWEPLLSQLDPRSPQHLELKVAVERLRRLAGMAPRQG